MMDWLAGVYVNAMNIIHYMHDKYAYERLEMALHDYAPFRTMAFGMAGMSVVADSLSAMRHAKVRVVRDATGLITDYEIEGEFPTVRQQRQPRRPPRRLGRQHVHEQAAQIPDLSARAAHPVDPDDHFQRRVREGDRQHARRPPSAASRSRPAPTPCRAATRTALHASAASVAKIPYRDAQDGISLTATLVPQGLGRVAPDRIANLTGMLDAFFGTTGFHMNINVLNRDTLLDAMDHPENYPNLTIRVSGYAVNFVRLDARAADGRHQPDLPWVVRHEPDTRIQQPVSLEAKSPFELRVNLGRDVPEATVRAALATGDMGFLHSFTTGSTVDGPGVRVVAWTTGCQMRCLYCHNPDTWRMSNGIPGAPWKRRSSSCGNTVTD